MHRYSLFGQQELDTYFFSWRVPQMLYYLDQGDFYDLELPEYDNLADIDIDINPDDDVDRGAGHVAAVAGLGAGEDVRTPVDGISAEP